jgi:hypothetical protein
MIKTSKNQPDPPCGSLFLATLYEDVAWLVESRLKNELVSHNCHFLVAMNELNERNIAGVLRACEGGFTHLIDSGVFNFATTLAKTLGVSMDKALMTSPADAPGFPQFLEKYINIAKRLDPVVWGIIEVDLGGRDNKIKTREHLESLGLRPIPVYHPINDGWDYFDFLASRYDRMCVGNVVMAPPLVRTKIIRTIFERRSKYPHLWIHFLGLFTIPQFFSFPFESCDSSSWAAGARWGKLKDYALERPLPIDSTNLIDECSEHLTAIGLDASLCSSRIQTTWYQNAQLR